MTILALTLELPDELAREAEAQGLLNASALEQLIRAEIGRRKHWHLREMMDLLAGADKGDLTPEDIQTEIDAYRAKKRVARARSN